MNRVIKSWNIPRTGLQMILLCIMATPTIADPIHDPGTDHYYEFVSGLMDWQDAVHVAETHDFQGVQGHLATITSLDENIFIATAFASGESDFFAWIAGYEPSDDGVWLWGAGPENGIQFSEDATPTAPFFFTNWGGQEPNDHASGEDFVAINLGDEFANVYPGQWIDSPNPNPADPILGLIVEYETTTSAVKPGDSSDAGAQLGVLDIAPNPFNPMTTVSFELPTSGPTQLAIYDIRGQQLRLLVNWNLRAGHHKVTWDGRDGAGQLAASGTYFCRLVSGDTLITSKLILVQ